MADYRQLMPALFFGRDSYIREHSTEAGEFWSFYDKFLVVQSKAHKAQEPADSVRAKSQLNDIGIVKSYHASFRHPFLITSPQIEDACKNGIIKMDTSGRETVAVAAKQVAIFRDIVALYVDFCQKKKFGKLVQLKRAQKSLPIWHFRESIMQTLQSSNVMVVAGDTGCGKSTQVPQYLLDAGYSHIACTQPRRIACISLAKRVGFETLNEYGSQVAYQVRFEKTKTKHTKITFLTEGLLLRQLQTDALLENYDVLVLDEVHERHVNTDFLLGVVKCLLNTRSTIKLILMSATINVDLFCQYFDNCPVIKIPGRLYPIELHYIPLSEEERAAPKGLKINPQPYLRVLQLIDHKYAEGECGDLLVFVSGTAEIENLLDAMQPYAAQTKRWVLLPLHSLLSVEDQDKVFDVPPEGVRKCVVATNIAETSVTIDGIRFICDSGKVKQIAYESVARVERLQEVWVSKTFQDYTTPEIQRVPLDSLVLQMMAMGLRDARQFPFIEPPDAAALDAAIQMLSEQAALTADEKLTPLGRMLAQLPVEVAVGKMLVLGSMFNMCNEVMTIAAALSVQSPFVLRTRTDHDAVSARQSLESAHGDPFTLWNAFGQWLCLKADQRRDTNRRHSAGGSTRSWCKKHALEEQRLYEIVKLRQQFDDIIKDAELVASSDARDGGDERDDGRSSQKRQLRSLRLQQRSAKRARRVLRMEFGADDMDADDAEPADIVDDQIKDLEFRMALDVDEAKRSHLRQQTMSHREFTVLKLILVSGLYPQVAIADEHNNFKSDSEQLYHSRRKQFLSIHPTSVFDLHPEHLALSGADVRSDLEEQERALAGERARLGSAISAKHQLVAFVSVIETRKPYMVGLLRVPALLTFLLFAKTIETNCSLSKVVFDEWIEVCVPRAHDQWNAFVDALLTAARLRFMWNKLLDLKLADTVINKQQSVDRHFDRHHLRKLAARIQRRLAVELTDFSGVDVCYAMRRLLPAEVSRLYSGPSYDYKGGIELSEFLRYDCLLDADDWAQDNEWECLMCKKQRTSGVLKRLRHGLRCAASGLEMEEEARPTAAGSSGEAVLAASTSAGAPASGRSFLCDVCGQQFANMTGAAFLRHKKQCRPGHS